MDFKKKIKKIQRDEGAGWLASMSSQRQPRCKEMRPSSGGVPWWQGMGLDLPFTNDDWAQGNTIPQMARCHDGRGWVGFHFGSPFYN
jgi:hypothetical protein